MGSRSLKMFLKSLAAIRTLRYSIIWEFPASSDTCSARPRSAAVLIVLASRSPLPMTNVTNFR